MNDDIERAVADLTDVSPSPSVRASVMRRIGEERAARERRGSRIVPRWWNPAWAGLPGRSAVAAVAVIILAAAAWFAWPPAPAPRVSSNPAAPRTIARQNFEVPPSPGPSLEEEHARPEEGQHARATQRARRLPGMEPRQSQTEATEPVSELPPAMSSIDVQPLPDPAPVALPPVTFDRIEIQQIDIPPVADPADKPGGPAKAEPDKRQQNQEH